MREPTNDWRSSATTILIVSLVVAFLVQKSFPAYKINEYAALSLGGIQRGFVWQLLTFQFLHAGPMHLLLNGFTLWSFGREVESTLGKPRFLTLYFLSGALGGLLQVSLALISSTLFGGSVVGASAGVFGVVAAFAMLAPDRMLTMLIFFVLPVHLRAKMLVWLSVAISVFGIALARKFNDGVAHAAHLGGILTGVIFMRLSARLPETLWNPFQSRRRKPELVHTYSSNVPTWPAAEADAPEELTQQEFISRQVDPILDKISQHGIQSLTEREKKILESARKKMAKR